MEVYSHRSENIFVFVLLLGLCCCCFFVPQWQFATFSFYAIVLLISLFLVFISEKTKSEKLFIVGVLFLGVPMAFRMQMGIDDPVYLRIFENAKNLSIRRYFQTSGTELGYLTLNWLLYNLTNGNYNVAQVVITFISFMIWGIAFKSLSQDKSHLPIMFLILWSHYHFGILSAGLVRIFIAIPIVLFAMHYIWTGNKKKFVLWILFASLFHISSLIMLLFLFFMFKDEWFYRHWMAFVMLVACCISGIFLLIARYLIPLLGERYLGYAVVNDMQISLGAFDTLPIWCVCLYFYRYIYKMPIVERRKYVIGMVLLALSVIFSIAASVVPLGRTIFYANLGMIILFSSIFKMKSHGIIDIVAKILIIVYALVYVMHTNILNPIQNENLFPYISFWGQI